MHVFILCGSPFGLMYMMIESDDVQTNREHELVGKPSRDFQNYLTEIQSNDEHLCCRSVGFWKLYIIVTYYYLLYLLCNGCFCFYYSLTLLVLKMFYGEYNQSNKQIRLHMVS